MIKVEPETGSGERYGLHSGICYHSGKQSIALDWMNDDDDRATFESLLATADVLVENCAKPLLPRTPALAVTASAGQIGRA